MASFRNLSIRAKVALMGSILIVAFLVLGVSFAYSLNTLLRSNLLLSRTQIALRESSEALDSMLEMRMRLREYLETGSPDRISPYQSAEYEVFTHMEGLRAAVADPALQRPIDPASLEQIARIDRAFRQWKREVADPYYRAPRPVDERALYRFLTRSEDEIHQIRQAVKEFQAAQQRLNVERYNRADQAASTASQIAFFGSGLTLLLVLLGFSLLSRSIMDPLFRLMEMGQAIASGDYSRRIPSHGQNELGRLATAFNVMAENLESVRGEQTAIRSRLEALNRLASYVSRSLHTRDRAEAVALTLRRDFGATRVQVWLPESNRGWIGIELHDDQPVEYRLYSRLPDRMQSIVSARRSEYQEDDSGGVEWISPLYRTDRINGILRIQFPADQWSVAEPLLSSINRFCTHAFELSRVYEEVSAERYRLDAILSSTGEGVLVRDLEGRVALANPAALRVLGLEDRSVLGRPLAEVLEREEYGSLRHFIETTPADGRGPEESGAIPLGERFITATRATIHDQGVSGAVVVLRDVTQQVEVDRMKSEFISIVSHELRTPLTSIKGSLGLLVGGAGGDLPDKVRHLLVIAQSNTDRLIRLINDILDISKIEAGRVEMSREPVDMAETIRTAVKEIDGMACPEKVQLEVRLPEEKLPVMGDSDRICQVIINLVSNAIKFSPPESQVTVRAELHHNVVEVDVTDEGPGIPLEHQAKLFQKFYQVDSSSVRAKSGTGLGLAISNAIVKEHGGLMGVDSQEGKGSRFWFTLPLARPMPSPQDQASPYPRVLVGYDPPDLAQRIGDQLDRNGYLCDRVSSGEEVYIRAKQAEYDLLLLDLFLPEAGSWDIAQRLDDDPETRHLPLIFLSHAEPGDADAGVRTIGWMYKPVGEKRFQDALRRALKFGRRKSDEPSSEAAPLVMVVQNDPNRLQYLASMVLATGMRVQRAQGAAQARELLREDQPDALVMDLRTSGSDGVEVIDAIRKGRSKAIPIMVFRSEALDDAARGDGSPVTRSLAARQSMLDDLDRILQEGRDRREAAPDIESEAAQPSVSS
ncbi:MAG: response regulator [Armatimonadetes bacterium]|nr:response regulator [Armatimonadota bacterium]